MADAMLDSIERFTEQNPESSLKLVKIVIFQQSMMQSFRKSAYNKARGKKGWLHGMSELFERVKGQLVIQAYIYIAYAHNHNLFNDNALRVSTLYTISTCM